MSVSLRQPPSGLFVRLLQAANLLLLLSSGLGIFIGVLRTPPSELAGFWSELALPGSRQWILLRNSLALAALVALGGTLLATLAAMAFARWRPGWAGRGGALAKVISRILLGAAALPPYLHALAWSGMFRLVDLPGGGDWFSAAWVQTLAFLPLAVIIVHTGMQGVEDDLVQAARLQQSDGVVLRKVVLPLTFPWILAAGAILFLLSNTFAN